MRQYWNQTSRIARPALVAVIDLFVLAVVVFVVLVAVVVSAEKVSVRTAIFGPGPGNPLIVWVYSMGVFILLQGGVVLALSSGSVRLRVVGAAAALAAAFMCLLLFAAVCADAIDWLVTGSVKDAGDLIAEVVFVAPVALLIATLNARSAKRSLADWRARSTSARAPTRR